MLYDELVKIYKKEHGQTFKCKDKEWKLKHDYKNHVLDYQPDQPQQPDQLILPAWVKVTKSGFNEIRSVITKGNESGLMTAIGKKITLSYTKKLVEGIINGKIYKSEARKMYNDIPENANATNKLNATKNRIKMMDNFQLLEEIFMGFKTNDKEDE